MSLFIYTKTADGFTLIEVLLYSGLCSLLLSVSLSFGAGILDASDRLNRQLIAEREARFVFDTMNHLLANAENPSITADSKLLFNKNGEVYCLRHDAVEQSLVLDRGSSVCTEQSERLTSHAVEVSSLAIRFPTVRKNSLVIEFFINGQLWSSIIYFK